MSFDFEVDRMEGAGEENEGDGQAIDPPEVNVGIRLQIPHQILAFQTKKLSKNDFNKIVN